jgi:hypothetical protein
MMRLRLLLAVFLPALFLVLPVLGGHGTVGLATALTAGLAAALAVAVVLTVRLEATAPVHVRAISLRERAQLCVRLRDPDAQGAPDHELRHQAARLPDLSS